MIMNSEDNADRTTRSELPDPSDDKEEKRVLSAALDSFRQYRRAAHYNITHLRRQSFYALPSAQVELLSSPAFSLPKKFDAVDEAIDSNADIAEAILAIGLPSFGFGSQDESWKGHATPGDLDKARSTIRQLYRDWSAQGLPERHAAFSPILSALQQHLPETISSERHKHRVLVPGAGLGRLVFDICAAGYSVEGNEISYHQLLASNYILNCVSEPGQHRLYPWALNFSNHHTSSDQLQSVVIPDIHPAATLEAAAEQLKTKVPYSERMSMTAGDFCVLYRQIEYTEAFNAVATCFFIDTAPNVISYMETIRSCLKPGGLWINLGPLLWHFESAPTPADRDKQRGRTSNKYTHSHADENVGIGEPGSFELSNEEVIALVESLGFEIVEHRLAQPTGYIQDPESMLQNVYRPVFWVARRK
ncbi:unnamed protein product [Zymoseptoria tritici ST99CH_1E4]|uniref:carnosine N-methyltransferase n=1 Tax=Zymoseptoria tritici ST99CH_1E4 TaxID=1276532 RepID=A0A2H1FXN9_ZYMTR|nr:unnamed protein product [Zymoseptoria tritici ST99CH_1E4]